MVLSVLDSGHSPYQGEAGRVDREWTAETVAAQSHGSFLVARLAATELALQTTVATESELLGWMRRGGVDLHTRLAEGPATPASSPARSARTRCCGRWP